jgi:hypothetical protein
MPYESHVNGYTSDIYGTEKCKPTATACPLDWTTITGRTTAAPVAQSSDVA